jgi:hypothetical protein
MSLTNASSNSEQTKFKSHHNFSYPEIVIIVGSPRSGTTYLQAVAMDVLDIGYSTEPKFVIPFYRRLARFGDLSQPENLRHLVETVHQSRMFQHLNHRKLIKSSSSELLERVQEPTYTGVLYAAFQLIAEKRGQLHLGYKEPNDVVNLPILARLLPTARFVHIIRDARGVATSLMKFTWGPNNVYSAGRYWSHLVSTGHRDGVTLEGRYFEFRLEDLMTNTENVAPELATFMTGGKRPAAVEAFVKHVHKTKDVAMVNDWKHKMSREQIYLCEAGTGKTLEVFGYEAEFGGKASVSPLRATYYIGHDLRERIRNRISRKTKFR